MDHAQDRSVMPADQFNALSASELAELQRTQPEIYKRSLTAALEADRMAAEPAEPAEVDGQPIIPLSDWVKLRDEDKAALEEEDPDLLERSTDFHDGGAYNAAGEPLQHNGGPILPASELTQDRLVELQQTDPAMYQRTIDFHAGQEAA